MAQHNLFRGGLSTRRNGWSFGMYPSADVGPNDFMEAASHQTPVDYAITWGLAPGNPCHEAPQRSSFMAQAAYFRELETPLLVGDVINAVIMPRFSSLIDLHYINCCPQPGLTLQVRLRGNADSLGGSEASPVPLTIATIDLGEVTWGSILQLPTQPAAGDGSDAGGGEADEDTGVIDPGDVFMQGQPGTIYFNQNDMLQLVITGLPEEGIDLDCLRFAMTPVMREYLRGDWISCMDCCGAPPAVPRPAPAAPEDPEVPEG